MRKSGLTMRKEFLIVRSLLVLVFTGAFVISSSSALAVPQTEFGLVRELQMPTPGIVNSFGWSAASLGDNFLIGSRGAGAVLFRSDTGEVLRSFPSFLGFSEFSVASYGDDVLIGAPGATIGGIRAGAVRLFDSETGAVIRTFTNPDPDDNDLFGHSVASHGNLVLIGAIGDDTVADGGGAAYLYDGVSGGLLHTFFSPNPSIGGFFGQSVLVSKNSVFVGAHKDDLAVNDAGAVYEFDSSSGELIRTYANPKPRSSDFFGFAVVASGPYVIIGTPRDDYREFSDAGAVYVFNAHTGAFVAIIEKPSPSNTALFGSSLAARGNRLVVGAPAENSGAPSSGAAYFFSINKRVLLAAFGHPSPALADEFGHAVAIVGNKVLVGAPFADGGGLLNAGVAYAFAPSKG